MRSDLSSYFEEPDLKQLIAKYEGMVKNHTPIYFDTDDNVLIRRSIEKPTTIYI